MSAYEQYARMVEECEEVKELRIAVANDKEARRVAKAIRAVLSRPLEIVVKSTPFDCEREVRIRRAVARPLPPIEKMGKGERERVNISITGRPKPEPAREAPPRPKRELKVDGRRNNGRKAMRVRCVETGVVYESQQDAANAIDGAQTCVSQSVRTGRPTKGYHFERVE